MICETCKGGLFFVIPNLCVACAREACDVEGMPDDIRADGLPRLQLAALLNATAAGWAWLTGEAKPHQYAAIKLDMSNAQEMYRKLAEHGHAPPVMVLLSALATHGATDARSGGVPQPPPGEPGPGGLPRVARPGDPDFPKGNDLLDSPRSAS